MAPTLRSTACRCRSTRWNRPEYYPGDRDKAVVNGQRHKIKVEIFSESKVVEQSFTVPFGQDMLILSVPKLVAGITPYVETFVPPTESAVPSDATQPQDIRRRRGGAGSRARGSYADSVKTAL